MKDCFVSAVIAAAGKSVRMNGQDKQLITLGKLPVIARAVMAFERSSVIDEIIVTTQPETLDEMAALLESYGFSKLRAVVPGGRTRQDSVFAGVRACSPQSEFYAIHDGARPLVSDQVIAQAVEAARQYGAAAPGVPVKETIKVLGPDGLIDHTPDRAQLCTIQTPQVIKRSIYEQGMAFACASHQNFTDDCQLAEAVGCQVFVSPGEERNLKITTPGDVTIYELLLKENR